MSFPLTLVLTCHRGRAKIERCDRIVIRYHSHRHLHSSISDSRNAPSAARALHQRRLETQAPAAFTELVNLSGLQF